MADTTELTSEKKGLFDVYFEKKPNENSVEERLAARRRAKLTFLQGLTAVEETIARCSGVETTILKKVAVEQIDVKALVDNEVARINAMKTKEVIIDLYRRYFGEDLKMLAETM